MSRRSFSSAAPLLRVPQLALVFTVLILSILLVSYANPSPWLTTRSLRLVSRFPFLSNRISTVLPAHGCQDLKLTTLEPRERAAIVLLLREQDLEELIPTLENFEEKFNAQFRYPYVFISSPDSEDFSDSFRETVKRTLPVGASTEWSVVPIEHWSIPDWMDADEVERGLKQQEKEGVQYAGRLGYHHMCRFYSGFWARQKVLEKYDWYWRLEPGVRFYCKITYDPFRFLSLNNKVYGFVITIVETANTIPTLFKTIKEYATVNGIKPGRRMWEFLTREGNDGKEEYSLCHFWTNFEIGDLRFFRGAAYQDLFNSLDKAGGFYTERWGDAPIRSIALGLLADVDQVHYFEDFAYKHDWFMHCPILPGLGCQCKCPAFGPGFTDIDRDDDYSCLPKWREAVAKRP